MRKKAVERWMAVHTFASERLVYRPADRADAAAMVANYDDEVRRWQGWEATTRSRRELEKQIGGIDLASSCAPMLLVCTTDGAIVGDFTVQPGRSPEEATLGWSFGPAGRGRGFGSESLPAILDYVHRHVGVPRVSMATTVDNHRALRQIATAGAVPDHHAAREHTLPNGAVVPARWFVHDDPAVANHYAVHGGWVEACRR